MNTVSSTGRAASVTDSRSTTPEQANPPAVESGVPSPSPRPRARRPVRSVASSANAPTLARCTAKPSLRTRQMCTVEHQHEEHREHSHVQRVEAQQRVLADLGTADQEVLDLPPTNGM